MKMHDHEFDERLDPALTDALRERLESAIAAADVRPDVSDMFARARELAAESSQAWTLEDEDEDEDLLDEDAGELAALDPELGPYAAALRDTLDQQLSERRLQPTPPLRVVSSRRQRRRWLTMAGVGLAAAALLLAFGLSRDLTGLSTRLLDRGGLHNQAADQLESPKGRDAVPRTPARTSTRKRGARASSPASAEAILEPSPEGAEEPAVEVDAQEDLAQAQEAAKASDASEASAAREASETSRRARRRGARGARRAEEAGLDVEGRIAALESEAQVHWRAGELRKASSKFREIIRIGGRRRSVEVAYGELFSLSRQLGGGREKLWRAYLKSFPRGLYAEDAKAGLCRLETGEARARCWEDYRARFPGGTHDPGTSGASRSQSP